MLRPFARPLTAFVAAAALGVAGQSGATATANAAIGGSRQPPPVWLPGTHAVKGGHPVEAVLNPRGARLCWVALRGPAGLRPVGWRFHTNGLRLHLTLLTLADAAPGRWDLRAVCRGPLGRSAARTAQLYVDGTGRGGLARHGDMRVSLIPGETAPATAERRVLAHRVIAAARGGRVRARNGVELFVPPGVLSRNGRAAIIAVGRSRYEITIDVPWRGRVAVSMPLKGRGDAILHRVGGVWVAEGRQRGQATVWVHQLSLFATLSSKAARLLCRSWTPRGILACLVKTGVKYVAKELAVWIATQISPTCVAAVLASAPFGRLAVALTVLLNDPCVGTATAPGAPPPPPPPPPPAPPPPPPPPLAPSVSLAKGASAQGQPGCSSVYCRYLEVTFANFSAGTHTIVCRASAGDEGGFYTYTRSGSSNTSGVCYYGYPGRSVWVTVDGVQSNVIVW